MIDDIIDLPEDFKKAIKSKNLIFGTKTVVNALRLGKIEKLLYASNIPEDLLRDLERYAKNSNAKLEKFSGTNDELGVKCKRSHSILAVALLKSK